MARALSTLLQFPKCDDLPTTASILEDTQANLVKNLNGYIYFNVYLKGNLIIKSKLDFTDVCSE